MRGTCILNDLRHIATRTCMLTWQSEKHRDDNVGIERLIDSCCRQRALEKRLTIVVGTAFPAFHRCSLHMNSRESGFTDTTFSLARHGARGRPGGNSAVRVIADEFAQSCGDGVAHARHNAARRAVIEHNDERSAPTRARSALPALALHTASVKPPLHTAYL